MIYKLLCAKLYIPFQNDNASEDVIMDVDVVGDEELDTQLDSLREKLTLVTTLLYAAIICLLIHIPCFLLVDAIVFTNITFLTRLARKLLS